MSRRYRAQISEALEAETGVAMQLVFEVGEAPRTEPDEANAHNPVETGKSGDAAAEQASEQAEEPPAEHSRAPADEAGIEPGSEPTPPPDDLLAAEDPTSGTAMRRAEPSPDGRRAQRSTRRAARSVGTLEEGGFGKRDFSRFRFDNYAVGAANSLAREAALALARGQHAHLRQLYLFAQPGQGKTHLARAAVREALERASGRVVYTHAEGFLNAFTASVRARRTDRFKQQFRRGCEVLVVEDIQFLIGKRATQIELVHTLEAVLDAGGRVLLTGSVAPAELGGLEAELRGQLSRSFVADISAPDAGLRREILRIHAANGGVRIPAACLDLLADAATVNVRELESALEQLVTTSALEGRAIDPELTRAVLERKGTSPAVCAHARRDPRDVVQVVAALCGTTAEQLASRSRRRDVMEPRQIAMVLCHRLTNAPIAEIGRAFGRKHTSVRNAITRLEREMLRSAPLRYRVESLSERAELRLREADGHGSGLGASPQSEAAHLRVVDA